MEVEISKEEKRLLIDGVNNNGVLDLSNRGLKSSKNRISCFFLSDRLMKVPKFIWKLRNLKICMLDHNEITEVVVPKKTEMMENLRVLDLSNNKIREMPENLPAILSKKNFEMLDVSYNQLRTLGSSYFVLFQKYELSISLKESNRWDEWNVYSSEALNPKWHG